VIKTQNDHALDEFFLKESEAEKVINDDAFNDFIEGIAEDYGMYEAERLIDRTKEKLMKEGVSSSIIKLKWLAPEVRARAFFQLLQESPEKADQLWQEAQQVKINSERFMIEVGRLIDESEANAPKE
jgi:hypothetical protein